MIEKMIEKKITEIIYDNSEKKKKIDIISTRDIFYYI